ncbi:MAG: acyl-CoA synthetase (AMP-forming)/AMP-acid ligase [Caulobacter sp.]|nr:acyl-CoA synthetase (AMP-forming)/AMP-acid ligase [Caulobacter sp.]
MPDLEERLAAAVATGMVPSVWAQEKPDAVALTDPFGWRSFSELNANANRLVRALRAAGLKPGDGVAVLLGNRAEFVETLLATLRGGFRFTPLNWHLTAEEIGYILVNCEAKALVAESRFPTTLPAAAMATDLILKVGVGDPLPGFTAWDEALADFDSDDITDPILGTQMLYTSGTTGRPKGVYRPTPIPIPPMFAGTPAGYNPDTDCQLCAGPAYHAAPLAFDIRYSLASGVPLVFMDRWDSEGVLDNIHNFRITHAHMVPIMFQRLLALPPEVKAKYDLSSLRFLVHGAAPCPPEVKRGMIDWLGPILHEYYAGSEGGAGFAIGSEDWLRKPGSVGKRPVLLGVRILDEEGRELPPGQPGLIYHQASQISPFTYYKDEAKTAGSYRDGYFTLGDMGYFDEDDFLFLTGRSAETIISGGVNIYPQEIDNELIQHPAVEDSCTIGAPDAEWGEAVKAVIKLRQGYAPTDALAAEILAFGKARLAAFKVPKSLDFVPDLPRSAAGKIQRGLVRKPYWEGRERQI